MNNIPIDTVVEHPLASSHPVYTAEQFEALKQDISKVGQIEPVTLYRGKLVDGRHRVRALKELGISVVKADSLPNNMTINEVKKTVLATEIRRHQTPTQLAIKAYRLWSSKEVGTQEEALKLTGASKTNLKYVNAICNSGRLDIITKLENGEKYELDFGTYVKPTDSLTAILRDLKEAKDVGVSKSEFDVDKEIEGCSGVNKAHMGVITAIAPAMDKVTVKAAIAFLMDLEMSMGD